MKIKTRNDKLLIARWVITFSFFGLMIAYVACIMSGFDYTSIAPIAIMICAGVLLMTLGAVIKLQGNYVDLDYDSIVVWKLCVVFGIFLTVAGIMIGIINII